MAPGPTRGLRRGPRGPLLSHKCVSKQLAELKWGPFRTRHKSKVSPLRSGVGSLRYETGPLRHEMGPLSPVMALSGLNWDLWPGMGPLMPLVAPIVNMVPLRHERAPSGIGGALIPELGPFSPDRGPSGLKWALVALT